MSIEKPKETKEVNEPKDAKNSKKPANTKPLFTVAYDPTERLIRIGALAIPTWVLSFIAGSLISLAIEALINHR